MRLRVMLALLPAILAVGCATMPPPATAPAPKPAPTMHVIEGRPEPPSAVDALQVALMDLKREKARVAILDTEASDLRVERDKLRKQVADMNGELLTLRSKVDTLSREQQDAMDALLTCEIEKAVLERRLLEIRLADLRNENEDGAR